MKKNNKLENIYSLTPMQKGMLYHYLIDKSTNEYVGQIRMDIHAGYLNRRFFEQTVNEIIMRHDALRTVFIYENVAIPRQVVLKNAEIKVKYSDLSRLPEDERTRCLKHNSLLDIDEGFDLSKDVLIKVRLFKIGKKQYRVVWTFHHIVIDGWCLQTIVDEFIKIYKLILKGDKVPSKPSSVPEYHMYLKWVQERSQADSLDYWEKYLEDYSNPAVIPKNNTIMPQDSMRADHSFYINENLTGKIKKLAVEHRVTVSNIVHAVWGLLLQKYNNTKDVVFGSVTSGRPSEIEGVDKIVGLFINTIPIRVKCSDDTTFIEIIKNVKKDFSENNHFSYIALSDIQKYSPAGRTLIDNIFAFENFGFGDDDFLKGDDYEISKIEGTDITNYDLDVNVYVNNHIGFRMSYNTAVYEKSFMANMEGHIKKIIDVILKNPEVSTKEISIVTREDEDLITGKFNATHKNFPVNKTIHGLFEEQVKKSPEKTAVEFGGKKLTYGELNITANRIAGLLLKKGVGRDHTVGIMLERSPLMMASILGVWKSGAAYIPIDSAYPVERVTGILTDSNTGILLSESKYVESGLERRYTGNIIRLNTVHEELQHYDGGNPELVVDTGNLAYVIYTSGSTGKPKGVMVEHVGMMNHMMAKVNELEINSESIIVQNASHCFDISVWQFFSALVCGGKTIIYSDELLYNSVDFVKRIAKDCITILEVVPSFLDVIIYQLEEEKVRFDELKYLVVTGEELKAVLVKKWFALFPEIKMVNAYGPTEASDDITHYIMDKYPDLTAIPIGKPLQNLSIYIVDEYMNLCPVGISGEIVVSGIGVGRGYINDKAKTGQVFMEDPFVKDKSLRLYKTGDLGRWSSGGNIEFLGRKDYQVKIRGFRIELGEIENLILQYENINSAIVTDNQDEDNNKYLCAFFTANSEIVIEELKTFLKSMLPEYMIPHYFKQLEAMPLTSNGKIDRRKLFDDEFAPQKSGDYEAPATKVEQLLTDVWGQIFNMDKLGMNDNFFAIGGDSIKAIQVTSRLMKHGFSLKVSDLKKYPTIKACAKYVKSTSKSVDQKAVKGPVELTAVQKMFFQKIYNEKDHFNQSLILFSNKRIDRQYLEKAFMEIIIHHDALRVQYENFNNSFMQYNQGIDDLDFKLLYYDLSGSDGWREDLFLLTKDIQESLTIKSELLLKAAVFKTRNGYYLFIVIHHLVVDGISWRVILEDLEETYLGFLNSKDVQLPPKTYSFKYWAKNMLMYANGNKIMNEVPYWSGLEMQQVPGLPVDNEIRERFTMDMETVNKALSTESTLGLLKDTNSAFNTEITDILLTALVRTVCKWSGSSKLLIDLEGHGREDDDMDVSRTVGWFTAIYPVILNIEPGEDIGFQIKKIKENLRIIPNKGIGYGLLGYLRKKRKTLGLNFNLKPELTFNYLGQLDNTMNSDLFLNSDVLTYRDRGDHIKSDSKLIVEAYVIDNTFRVQINYNKYEFNKETVESICEKYIEEIIKIVDFCCDANGTGFTPGDFDHNELSQDDVDGILDYVNELEFIE